MSEPDDRLRALDERQGRGADSDLELFGAYCAVANRLGTNTPDDQARIRWLLNRQYLPEAEPSRLTHGICPTCVATMESEMAG